MSRYVIRLSQDGNTFVTTNRLIVDNFRRQSKSLGAATLTMLSLNSLYPLPGESEPALSKATNYTEQERPDGLLKETTLLSIHDTTLGDDDGPRNRVFLGYITFVTSETEAGTQKNGQGIVNVNEIGWLLTKIMVRNAHYNKDGSVMSNPPAFNPVIDGKTVGNKAPGVNRFLFNPNEFVYTTNTWSDEDQDRVWSRQDVIETVVTSTSQYSISFSIEFPSDNNNEIYRYFTAKSKTIGWPSFYNQPLSTALDELIEDPLSYYVDYSSSFALSIKIYNKSNVDLSDGEDILIPGAKSRTVKLNQIKPPITKLNISEVQGQVDRVVVRGAPIVCCGTFTTWPWDSMDTLKAGWIDYSAEFWEDKFEEAFAYVRGSFDATPASNADDGDAVRAKLERVYQKFVFDYYKDKIITIVRDPRVDGDHTRIALCPRFTFYDDNGELLTTPTYDYEIDEEGGNVLTHSTPNPLSLKWADFIPVYKDINVNSGSVDKLVDDNLAKPFVVTPTVLGSRFARTTPSWIDITVLPQQQSKLEFQFDGVFIRHPKPTHYDADSGQDSLERLWEGKQRVPTYWRGIIGPTKMFNPATGRPAEGIISHWSRFHLTGAILSDQSLEISKTRKELNEDSELKDVDVINEHVINDDSLQLWFIHANTVTGLRVEFGQSTLRYQAEDQIVRNDIPIAKNILDNAFAWLSQKKAIATLEYQLNNCDFTPANNENIISVGQFQIGEMIGRIEENGYSYDVNTSIESIEFSSDGRMTINTENAKMPELRRLANTPVSVNSPNFSYQKDRRSVTSSTKTKPTVPKQPIISEMVASTNGTSSSAEQIFVAKVATKATPLPLPKLDSTSPINLAPDIGDWTDYDLAQNWSGSVFPETPVGITYLELVRPYNIDSSSWAADILAPIIENPNSSLIEPNRVITDPENINTLYVYFTKDITTTNIAGKTFNLETNGVTYNLFCLSETQCQIWSGSVKLYDGTISTEDYGLKFELNGVPFTATSSVSIFIPSSVVLNGTNENTSASINIVIGSKRGKYVYGLVHVDEKSYGIGDLVLVSREQIGVSDENDQTRICYRILGPATTDDPSIFVIEGGSELGYFTGLLGIAYFDGGTPSIPSSILDVDLSTLPILNINGLGYARNLNSGSREFILHSSDYSPNGFDIPIGSVIYAPETIQVPITGGGTLTCRIPVAMA